MTTKELHSKANQLRRDIVRMIGPEKTGHLGGSFSLAEIVTVLYYHVMRVDPRNPSWPDRDRFLLSKGHAALIQYAALADLGVFPKEELLTLKQLGSRLQGHPDLRKLPGIEANTGSLGQGLSIAAGMAAGLRLDHRSSRVYCCVGDGELAEGQIWEAAMAAGIFKLNQLTAIIDVNGLQATGFVSQRYNTLPYRSKFEAFGWRVIELDGHDIPALCEAFEQAAQEKEKPTALLAKTTKGKGLPFAENEASFHNGSMSQEQYGLALKLLSEGGESA